MEWMGKWLEYGFEITTNDHFLDMCLFTGESDLVMFCRIAIALLALAG